MAGDDLTATFIEYPFRRVSKEKGPSSRKALFLLEEPAESESDSATPPATASGYKTNKKGNEQAEEEHLGNENP